MRRRKSEEYYFQVIADENIKIISFDIFDTLLLRPFYYPTDLFFFLDRELSTLLNVQDVIDFSNYRKEAEERIRKEKETIGYEDVTLAEIYQYIEEHYPFPKELINRMMQSEIVLEKKYCYARQFGKNLLKFAVEQKKRVILVSDMYLPGELITQILLDNDIYGFEKIYVSSETRRTKKTGNMYSYISKELGFNAKDFLHIGDNLYSDIKVPRKMGWNVLPLYKTTDLFENKISGIRTGNSYRHSFKNLRSSISSNNPLDYLGLRCLLAVAVNRVFDNPFHNSITHGDYAGNIKLFGNIALGLYCLSQGLWIAQLAREEMPSKVLFFSRDGYLPYQVYNVLGKYIHLPEAVYIHISRKAIYPLLLMKKERLYSLGTHINYQNHTPESLVRILKPILDSDKIKLFQVERKNNWSVTFPSESDMMEFLQNISENCLDHLKCNNLENGFKKYILPYANIKILTYDVGYNIRNESIIKSFYPDTEITACFSHTSSDLPLKRGIQSQTKIKTFFNSSPYVSWIVRECFLTADEPSCLGYDLWGNPVYEKKKEQSKLVRCFQKEALEYVNAFVELFKEDALWLPLELVDATLPFEAFLHSPCHADVKWVKKLHIENEADSGNKQVEFLNIWRKLRTEYKIAHFQLNAFGRHVARSLMLLFTDRKELRQTVLKKLPFLSNILKRGI